MIMTKKLAWRDVTPNPSTQGSTFEELRDMRNDQGIAKANRYGFPGPCQIVLTVLYSYYLFNCLELCMLNRPIPLACLELQ